jgi:hypothetical protein
MKNFYKNDRPRSSLPSPRRNNSLAELPPMLPFPRKHSAEEQMWRKSLGKRSFRKSSQVTGGQEHAIELTHYDNTLKATANEILTVDRAGFMNQFSIKDQKLTESWGQVHQGVVLSIAINKEGKHF